MLGPGIVVLGTPLAVSVSLVAVIRSLDRPFAIAALTLSGLELLLLATVIILIVWN